MNPRATVISVHRGGCDVIHGGRVRRLRLTGRHVERGSGAAVSLAVGDEVTFDSGKGIVLERLPRRTKLSRLRRGEEHVIAANVDQLLIVTSVLEPSFRSGVVDRFQVAALSGELEAILVVNKLDLLQGAELPEEVLAYEGILPLYPVSARSGEGIDALREGLGAHRSVLAGHSGVGKTSLLNALEPDLGLVTAEVTVKKKGRHTTTRAHWLELRGGAVVIDTPGVREIASGALDPALVARAYADVHVFAASCHFRDCRHRREPSCAVREAIERGELAPARVASFHRLLEELEEAAAPAR